MSSLDLGKTLFLPRGYQRTEAETRAGVQASVTMFAGHHPGLGSQINARESTDRPGRINTIRLHPRETSTLIGGLVVHRGNLDYQDLRTVLDDPDRDDVQLPLEIKVHQTKRNAAVPRFVATHRLACLQVLRCEKLAGVAVQKRFEELDVGASHFLLAV